MKTYINLLFIILFSTQTVFANAPLFEETRVIERSFNVKSDALLEINNRYGNVTLSTWDKNQIDIKVEIKVDGKNSEAVKNRLNGIAIEFSSTNSLVSAVSKIADGKWGNKTNIKINYIVKLPKSNHIFITNRYGNVYLDELSGTSKFKLDYGNLTVGKLFNASNLLNLEYMTAVKIDYMKSGTLDADYSKIDITKADLLKVRTDYSDVKINQVSDVNCVMDYGNLIINNVDKVTTTLDYTNLKIGVLQKTLVHSGDYGTVSVAKIKQGFDKIILNGDYTSINLSVEQSAQYNILANLKYGTLKYPENVNMSKVIEKSTSKYYEGKTNNPSGKIELNLTYGSVKLNLIH